MSHSLRYCSSRDPHRLPGFGPAPWFCDIHSSTFLTGFPSPQQQDCCAGWGRNGDDLCFPKPATCFSNLYQGVNTRCLQPPHWDIFVNPNQEWVRGLILTPSHWLNTSSSEPGWPLPCPSPKCGRLLVSDPDLPSLCLSPDLHRVSLGRQREVAVGGGWEGEH